MAVMGVNLHNIFHPNRRCIINADLDGILSGMLLQKYLNWEVMGFSSCSGGTSDEIWVTEPKVDITECVFVDLPVATKMITTIDQHFTLLDNDSVGRYLRCGNKINPNAMRGYCYNNGDYCSKYPFGTVHFIIACLENIEVIKDTFLFNVSLDGCDKLDVLFRADGVVKNMYNYTQNCTSWSNWMMDLGGYNTSLVFNTLLDEYQKRYLKISEVEKMLASFGCKRKDGDCSNMISNGNLAALQQYINWLALLFNVDTIHISNLFQTNKLSGIRTTMSDNIGEQLRNPNIFSYAMVNSHEISITYRLGKLSNKEYI